LPGRVLDWTEVSIFLTSVAVFYISCTHHRSPVVFPGVTGRLLRSSAVFRRTGTRRDASNRDCDTNNTNTTNRHYAGGSSASRDDYSKIRRVSIRM